MIKKIQRDFFWYLGLAVFIMFIISVSTNQARAQNSKSQKAQPLQPLHSGVGLYDFTGNLQWQTYYVPAIGGGLEQHSQTELRVNFRNINMLNAHYGLGYKFFTTVYMTGFFKGGGLGGVGGGPVVRYYPLKTTRWQPYLQGSMGAGYNLALSDALGINDVGGFRFRSALRGGLNYKVSNAFGIFFEIGPTWEYNEGFELDSHALELNVGIELFRF